MHLVRRVKEWYGWHFPELAKIVQDDVQYLKCVLRIGVRDDKNISIDFSDILDSSTAFEVNQAMSLTMGTPIGVGDYANIRDCAIKTLEVLLEDE